MEELSRLILLLLVAALVINLIKGGPGAVGEWWKAKFLGRPVSG
jgi:hypothetical protein